jgi:hypothetical protein
LSRLTVFMQIHMCSPFLLSNAHLPYSWQEEEYLAVFHPVPIKVLRYIVRPALNSGP